eukprot:scaffold54405_cov55-Phaeocystis_antarctica.AAC.6
MSFNQIINPRGVLLKYTGHCKRDPVWDGVQFEYFRPSGASGSQGSPTAPGPEATALPGSSRPPNIGQMRVLNQVPGAGFETAGRVGGDSHA